MVKNRYFYYDHDSCSFVEVKERRAKIYLRTVVIVVAALLLSGALTLGMDRFVQTPQELALMDENAALQKQLSDVGERISSVSAELANLNKVDQNLYRTLLQADRISEDIRQVGVGGTNPFPEFSRFSPSTSSLLQRTSEQLERLEAQISLQNDSYRELTRLARDRETAMSEMPAIIPTDGVVFSGFGMRFHPVLKVRRMHWGIDIHVNPGSPVVASGNGVIRQVGTGSDFGVFIKIGHPTAGYTTLYAHLSRIPRDIRRGKTVKRGDIIAYSGNTGLTSGPHLHYEVRDRTGSSLNPLFFLAPSMTPTAYKKLLEETERTTISLD